MSEYSRGTPRLTACSGLPVFRFWLRFRLSRQAVLPQTFKLQSPSARRSVSLKLCALAVFAALSITDQTSQAQPVQSGLPTQDLYAGMHRIIAEVAATPDQRAIGLMGRQSLADNRGMLFVFELPQRQCFWMEQTFVPLSIAFLREDGTITNIEDMQPLSRESHCSTEPVRLALEVNQGWFDQRNIKPGMQIRGLPAHKPVQR